MSALEVDTLKNSGGTKTLAEVSGGEFVWGTNAPSGTVMYMDQVTVLSSGASGTETTYTPTGLEITVPSVSVALGTKIEIAFTNNIWAEYNSTAASQALIDIKLARTAPSAVDLFIGTSLGHYLLNFHISAIYSGVVQDESLGSGDHTYKVMYRKAGGSANAAGSIFPLGTNSGDKNVIIAKVLT